MNKTLSEHYPKIPKKRQEAQTIHAIAKAIYYHDKEILTRREICEAIGRAKSPHLIKIIEKMVSEGHLIKERIDNAPPLGTYLYRSAKRQSEEAAKKQFMAWLDDLHEK